MIFYAGAYAPAHNIMCLACVSFIILIQRGNDSAKNYMEEIGSLILFDAAFRFLFNYSEMGSRVRIISGFLHGYSCGFFLYILPRFIEFLVRYVINGVFWNYFPFIKPYQNYLYNPGISHVPVGVTCGSSSILQRSLLTHSFPN